MSEDELNDGTAESCWHDAQNEQADELRGDPCEYCGEYGDLTYTVVRGDPTVGYGDDEMNLCGDCRKKTLLAMRRRWDDCDE